mgnify:FL=1
MNKKILILYGSPHKNGFTFQVLKRFLRDNFKDEVKFINAYEKNAKPCIDCKKCRNVPGCIFKDMEDIDEYFKACEILIIASPIYNNSVPAPLKSIIDRMQRYYSEKIYLKSQMKNYTPKKALLLFTQGSSEKKSEKILISQLKPNLLLINVKEIYSFLQCKTDMYKPPIDKEILENDNKIQNIVNNLYNILE